ncbi:Argininosuccinate lyase [Alphaproteobacteria bacterium SO-S41]|nr:Argininosuccinate lyase [Alphaproteobacteria bacterium SO-S41]
MWGGRFAAGPDEVMAAINVSIGFDRRMAKQDIEGSLAHVRMLEATRLISAEDSSAIQGGLNTIASEIREGRFPFREAYEDIHMNVEARLAELIGTAAGRLHTARSRNDQVATDFRLWVRDAIDAGLDQIGELMSALVDKAIAHAAVVMPGFTHMQSAQPVTFGHHCLAFVEMFERDRGRLRDARARLNESPLGAAALAGTSFPIDRAMTAKTLGFDRPMRNSLDAVSARDFAMEYLAAGSILAIHMSRLAEEIIVWSTAQFGFVRLSDRFSTGSSIMPQKRNPDAAELVRGKTGRVIGSLIGLMTVMKALPLAYAKDMQEDKEAVFAAADTLSLCLAALTGMIGDLTINPDRMHASASAGFATATDLADWLVVQLKMPFREAHHVTGRLVKAAEKKGVDLTGLTLAEMKAVEPQIVESVFDVLTVDSSVASRSSLGGTSPDNVRREAETWRDKLKLQ